MKLGRETRHVVNSRILIKPKNQKLKKMVSKRMYSKRFVKITRNNCDDSFRGSSKTPPTSTSPNTKNGTELQDTFNDGINEQESNNAASKSSIRKLSSFEKAQVSIPYDIYNEKEEPFVFNKISEIINNKKETSLSCPSLDNSNLANSYFPHNKYSSPSNTHTKRKTPVDTFRRPSMVLIKNDADSQILYR